MRAVLLARRIVNFRQRGQDARHVHHFRLGAGEFGIQARGVGNIGNQPVQPGDILRDDGEQPRGAGRVFHPRQGFDGRADG